MRNQSNVKVEINGHYYDYDAAVNLMDDEIRESLSNNWIETESWPNECQKFMDAYCVEHAKKYNQEFLIG